MVGNIVMENATVRFRNFSGKEGRYNPAGKRNFCVFLDAENAEKLLTEGWNVKKLTPRDPADPPQDYLQVEVSYKNIPPTIYLISSGGKQLLDEGNIDILDWAEIEKVDLIIRPYSWEVNGKSGIKAYCKTMYVTIAEDEFAELYKDVPDSAKAAAVVSDELPFA